jgi:vitamin B12 transporter
MFFLQYTVAVVTCFLFFFHYSLIAVPPDWNSSVIQEPANHTNLQVFEPVIVSDTIPAPHLSDSLILQMDEIHIQSTRIREPLRYQPVDIQLIDSLQLAVYRSLPVSDVLSRYSSLFIRDNGPGGLATLSQRGFSASQTQVLWEGFPVNSLSLGLSDLSTIPSGMFQSVEVSPGTPSSTFGGGSMGGIVFLTSSQRSQQNLLTLTQSAGAFGTFNSSFETAYSSGRWSGTVNGIYHTSDNDYPYVNRATGQEEYRTHNSGQSVNLMGNIGYNSSGARFFSSIWYFDNRDEIPGSILSGNSEAVQSLDGIRWTGGADFSAGKWRIKTSAFLERNQFSYVDPPSGIESRFRLNRNLAEIGINRPSTGTVHWQGGISGGLERVDTNNYRAAHERQLFGIRLNPDIRLSGGRIRVSPAVRTDTYSGFGWVVSPSLGGNWELIEERFHLKGMVSYDFNPPSFNDLHWVPGGNPNLDAERSFKTEGGFVWLPDSFFLNSLHLTGYRIWLDNGIYWFPNREGIWSPSNIKEVDAYGAEARIGTNWQLSAAEFSWNTGLDWRRSQIARERFPGDQGIGRQMRYVPEWAVRSDLTFRISRFMLHANHRWTGRRFITEDHTSSLDPFHILDLTATLEQSLAGTDWIMMISIHNLLNEQFEIIQWYPMPGRYINVTVRMELPL